MILFQYIRRPIYSNILFNTHFFGRFLGPVQNKPRTEQAEVVFSGSRRAGDLRPGRKSSSFAVCRERQKPDHNGVLEAVVSSGLEELHLEEKAMGKIGSSFSPSGVRTMFYKTQ